MGVNPMQKMKRNSTLTGLLIGLIIGLILCAVLYLFLTTAGSNMIKGESKTVYILGVNAKSGETIPLANILTKNMSVEDIPADAITTATPITTDVIAKIDLTAGTTLTVGMLNPADTTVTNDLRQQEYNMVALPTYLEPGQFIDIRLQLPNGGDYIVVSKKKVLDCNASTIWLNMYEEEIELMSNAIIEYYIMAGSKLYATKYTDPGIQAAAVGTYVPNGTVAELISSNPNITSYLNSDRYSNELKAIRNKYIDNAVKQYNESAIANIEENIKDEIKSLKEAREAYFGAVNAAQ